MSGTSLDGIDVAIVDVARRNFRIVTFRSAPYPASVREAILGVSNTTTTTGAISRLSFFLGELYAQAVIATCRRARVPLRSLELIGCHGQTIYHEGEPARLFGRRVASTMQIGEAAVLAERTGIPVVSDFRTADMAVGGKGAPLVPYVDYLLFRHPSRTRVALNIGGIANVTIIPAGAEAMEVIAFDTGPGNMVIDALAREHTGGRKNYDAGGRIAARGHVIPELLDKLLANSYYRRRPPKTAGREQYGAEFVAGMKATGAPLTDLIATATVLTAATVALGLQRFPRAHDLIVSGGGAHNPQILAHLAAFLPGVALGTSTDYGVDVDAKEAIAFAILAQETWRHRPSNLPSATGARRPVILGKLTRL
jgi:anhydro-N-acetylmuramic acid kinase